MSRPDVYEGDKLGETESAVDMLYYFDHSGGNRGKSHRTGYHSFIVLPPYIASNEVIVVVGKKGTIAYNDLQYASPEIA
jgi:hypothetical protein